VHACINCRLHACRWKSTAALPTVLLVVPLLWYSALLVLCSATGQTWAELTVWLQEHVWVEPPPPGGGTEPFWKARATHMHAEC
jgi:hypothetical protein